MGSCEDLLKDACAVTNESEETSEGVDLEDDITLRQLVKCQQEIDILGCTEFHQILREIKTFDEDCKRSVEELFQQRNLVTSQMPGFWMNAISKNPKLPFRVSKYEKDCLKYLINFIVEELKDEIHCRSGFIVSFTFHDNPYLENKMLSKMISWNDDGIIESTNTPIIWKNGTKSDSLHDELLKSICAGSCSFFQWFTENEGPKSINFLQILELWHDPLRYYRLSEDCPQPDGSVENSLHLERLDIVKTYQDNINRINKVLDDDLAKCTSHIGEDSRDLKKTLYDERNRLIQDIPNFWSTVIANHPDLCNMIGNEEEQDCLQYLTKIDMEDVKISEDLESKMTIHFYFAEGNPYLSNSVISKEFTRKEGQRFVKSTPIEWKDNKCLFRKQDDGDGKERNSLTIFDWLNDDSSPETHSHITLPVLQVWEDPVQYYLKALYGESLDECCQHGCRSSS